jgi:hypothetical protein
VEAILNLRPEDKRDLIEEAADIQRYRLKIEEPSSALADARNIERVKLLVKEIAPRMTAGARANGPGNTRCSPPVTVALRSSTKRWAHAQV